MFSPFSDRTIAGTAWVTLVLAWFLAPLWATAVNVPFAAAVVSRDGHVHTVREVARYPEYKVWFMIDHPGTRTVHNVSGKIVASSIEIDYRYADSYIATRQHNEDLAEPLTRAASVVLKEEAQRPRAAKIALVDDAAVQSRVIERICTADRGRSHRVSAQDEAAPPERSDGARRDVEQILFRARGDRRKTSADPRPTVDDAGFVDRRSRSRVRAVPEAR